MHRFDANDRLASLGWDAGFEESLRASGPQDELVPARVCAAHRGSYAVRGAAGEWRADVTGRFGYLAAGPEDWPAVGDWVAVALRPQERAASIVRLLPRRSALRREAAGPETRAQVLAANVDTALLVTSVNRDFNTRRVERTLAMIHASGAQPVLVLSKCDLAEAARVTALADAGAGAAAGAPVVAISALTGAGLDALSAHLAPRRTAVLLGSSGVGKSTLLNRLAGRELQTTRSIREDDDRGRHATTHRELFALPGGALLIDTPGLREIALWAGDGDAEPGLDSAFPELEALEGRCRFRDCRHESEPGCAVRAALEDGSLDAARLASHRKLERELRYVRERHDARARHEHSKRMRRFARAMRKRPDKRSPRE